MNANDVTHNASSNPLYRAVCGALDGAVEAVVWKGLEREVHLVVNGTIDCWDVYNAQRMEPTSPKIQSFLRESYACKLNSSAWSTSSR